MQLADIPYSKCGFCGFESRLPYQNTNKDYQMTKYHVCGQPITVIWGKNAHGSVPIFLTHDAYERTITRCPECGDVLFIGDMEDPIFEPIEKAA